MIRYLEGDATRPEGDGPKVIVHVCNDLGLWGSGFVVAISKRWPEPEAYYRKLASYGLGRVQFVTIYNDLTVANMIAQHGRPTPDHPVAIDYTALETCLRTVELWNSGPSIHMPRIGCGIAGGKWSEVEKIIERSLPDSSVFVYDLPGLPYHE